MMNKNFGSLVKSISDNYKKKSTDVAMDLIRVEGNIHAQKTSEGQSFDKNYWEQAKEELIKQYKK